MTEVTWKSRSGLSSIAALAASGDTTAHTLASGALVASSTSPNFLKSFSVVASTSSLRCCLSSSLTLSRWRMSAV